MEKEASAALGWRSATAPAEEEQSAFKQLERAVGRSASADRNLKKRVGRVSCGEAHSQARRFVAQGSPAS
jgi:hypothetical protein